MSIRISIAALVTFAALAGGAGCNISHCEGGADCSPDGSDEKGQGDVDRGQICSEYCARVSICGGSQAHDFSGCVEACEARFEVLPEETERLCACAAWSSCGDVIEGRCSEDPQGGGGTTASGGTTGSGGAPSSGGGSGAGGTGSGGEAGSSTGTPCSGDCDCAAGTSCVDGYCIAP